MITQEQFDLFEEAVRARQDSYNTLLKKTKDEKRILPLSAAMRELDWILSELISMRLKR